RFRRESGARGGGDAVVVLRGAGPLHPRSAAAASARRARHQPALLVQLRHRRRSLRPVRARRSLRQSDHVSRRRVKAARRITSGGKPRRALRLVWRLRNPHHFFFGTRKPASVAKPHYINNILLTFSSPRRPP